MSTSCREPLTTAQPGLSAPAGHSRPPPAAAPSSAGSWRWAAPPGAGGVPSCPKPPGDVRGAGPSPPACPGPVGALPPAAPRGKSQSSAQPASARKYLFRRGETGGEPRRVCRRTDGAFPAEGLCARRAPSCRTCGARLAWPGPARPGSAEAGTRRARPRAALGPGRGALGAGGGGGCPARLGTTRPGPLGPLRRLPLAAVRHDAGWARGSVPLPVPQRERSSSV